jgi:hypothetical protein
MTDTLEQAPIRELPAEFTGKGEIKGFDFKQVYFDGEWYIYSVEQGGQKWYEAFKRKVYKRFNIVSYPGAKSFGNWAWTTQSFERAMKFVVGELPPRI